MGVLALFGISLNPLSYLGSFISGMFSATLKLFGQSASDVVAALLGFITATSDPVFSGGWWSSSGEAVFVRVVTISGALMALSFMLSIITSLLAGDPKLLMKAVLHLPLAVIQTGLLVTVTAALLSATDEVSSYIASGASHDLTNFVTVGMVAAITDSSIVGLIIGGLIILAAISVWLQLIVRTALLYVTVLGAPLVFAASVHPSVRGLQKRYIEFGIGLICAKVVIALAFATAAAALGSLGSSASFAAEVGALLEALAILLVACFAPYLFVRLLIGAEALVIAEGLERRPLRAAMHAQQGSYYLRAGGGLSGLLHGMGSAAKGGGASPGRPDPGAGGGNIASGGDGNGPSPGPSSNGGSPRPPSPASPSAATTGGRASTAGGGVSSKAPLSAAPVPAGLAGARQALRAATKGGAADGAENGISSPHGAAGSPSRVAPERSAGSAHRADSDHASSSNAPSRAGEGSGSIGQSPVRLEGGPGKDSTAHGPSSAVPSGSDGARSIGDHAGVGRQETAPQPHTSSGTTSPHEAGVRPATQRSDQSSSRRAQPAAGEGAIPTPSRARDRPHLERPPGGSPTDEPRS
jgi:hypothetical protein